VDRQRQDSHAAEPRRRGRPRALKLFDLFARDRSLVKFDAVVSTDTEQLWHKQAHASHGCAVENRPAVEGVVPPIVESAITGG
jgi:hypothetical protein